MVALMMDSLGRNSPNKKCAMVEQRIRVDEMVELEEAKPKKRMAPSPRYLARQQQLDILSPQQRLQLEDSRWRLHSARSSGALPHQCSNVLLQRIDAPLSVVWPVIRRFDMPQAYKRFVKACVIASGDGSSVGSLRNITLVSGLPARCSTERLEILDDEQHIASFRVVGGEHRLRNYASLTSLHEFEVADRDELVDSSGSSSAPAAATKVVTVVMESYVVDVPDGNTKDETRVFTDTVVECNLDSLAKICQASFRSQQREAKLHKQVEGLIFMR